MLILNDDGKFSYRLRCFREKQYGLTMLQTKSYNWHLKIYHLMSNLKILFYDSKCDSFGKSNIKTSLLIHLIWECGIKIMLHMKNTKPDWDLNLGHSHKNCRR